MRTRTNQNHPALKHGAYTATAVLPGESRAAFEKLHRDLIAEYAPSGVLEDDIIADMARLVWRKQNLRTLRVAELAQSRYTEITDEQRDVGFSLRESYRARHEEETQAAEDYGREELGDIYKLVELGEAVTFDGLTKELDIRERLDAAIARCLKLLLLVRGVKSVAATPAGASPKRALAPPKAA
jgi:hypothetical protein